MNKDIIELSRSIMFDQVGVIEKQKNWGGQVTKYINSVGLNYPIAYCGAGQYYCLKEAADSLGYNPKTEIPFNARKSASSQYWYTHAKEIGIKTVFSPHIDDLIVWRKRNTGKGHVERIDSVGLMGWVYTVGFNTSLNSGNTEQERNGDGVAKRRRHLYSPIGLLSIRGLVGLTPEPEEKPK
jgi:hypothetical protein